MLPLNRLSNNIFNTSNPEYMTLMFNEYCAKRGITINQNKTVSEFFVPLNAVVVGNTVVNFTANAPFSSATTALQYPESEHFLITGIRGLDAAAATLTLSNWVAGIADTHGSNGYLTINNNGTNVNQNLRFTAFQKGTNSPDAGWYFLSKPIMLLGQTNLTVTGTWATAPTTANYNMSLELHGIKLI